MSRRRTRASRALPRPEASVGFFARVYELVRAIPRGRVATYGQIAFLAGSPRGARAVGWALRALSAREERSVPWHRVVGGSGAISPRAGAGPFLQARRLRAEGVAVRRARVDLARYAVNSRTSTVNSDGRVSTTRNLRGQTTPRLARARSLRA